MVSKKTVNTLLASAVALTVAGGVSAANAMEAGKEKCYGVVKAGHNDCANAAKTHSCAGHAAVDGDGGEWLALPAGVCEKLVGGHLEPVEGTHHLNHSHDGEASAKDAMGHAKDAMHDAAKH